MCLQRITKRNPIPTTDWEEGWKYFYNVVSARGEVEVSIPTFPFTTPSCLEERHMGAVKLGEEMLADETPITRLMDSEESYISGFHCFLDCPSGKSIYTWNFPRMKLYRVRFRGVSVEGEEDGLRVAVARELVVIEPFILGEDDIEQARRLRRE